MKKMIIVAFIIVSAFSLFAQDKTDVKISGYVLGDYAYKLGGYATPAAGSSQYSAWNKADQQFQFRRIYLQTDYTINENFATQVLLEGNDGTYVIGTKNRMGFYAKRAFLEWKNLIPQASVFIGLITTPTFDLEEREWNYRSIEKTVTDFRIGANASDLGVSVKGKIDEGGMFSYHVMVGNGTAQSAENDKYKKAYASFTFRPVKDLAVDLYGDYMDIAGSKTMATYKVYASYKLSDLHLGAEYFDQVQGNATPGHQKETTGFSAYAWTPLVKSLNAVARLDTYNPDVNVTTSGYKEMFYTLGLDYTPDAKVHIIPNVWINSFSEQGTSKSKDADVVARLTFQFIFK